MTKKVTLKLKRGHVGSTEWWTEKDWEEHRAYVEELEAAGIYGEEYEIDLTVKDYSPFDTKIVIPPVESYRFTILNFGKDKK